MVMVAGVTLRQIEVIRVISTNNLKNIRRYWIRNDDGLVVREWSEEEYENVVPETHIHECVILSQCEHCGSQLHTCFIDQGHCYCWQCYNKNRRNIRYPNCFRATIEMRCLEIGEKEIDGKFVTLSTIY